MIAVFQSLLLASAVEVFQPAAELPVLEETDVLVVGSFQDDALDASFRKC